MSANLQLVSEEPRSPRVGLSKACVLLPDSPLGLLPLTEAGDRDRHGFILELGDVRKRLVPEETSQSSCSAACLKGQAVQGLELLWRQEGTVTESTISSVCPHILSMCPPKSSFIALEQFALQRMMNSLAATCP